jgi:dTDP-glucose 4,6-dehydratase
VRDWIHVDDHCGGIVAALFEGKPGMIYNFGGLQEMVNLDLVKMILNRLGKPESLISFVEDRLGHDRRYAIETSFSRKKLNWKPRHNFEQGLSETIQWYIDNQSWWQPLLERAGRY